MASRGHESLLAFAADKARSSLSHISGVEYRGLTLEIFDFASTYIPDYQCSLTRITRRHTPLCTQGSQLGP